MILYHCRIFLLSFIIGSVFLPGPVFSQRNKALLKAVQLDTFVVTASGSGFRAEEFIDMVRRDTSFYKAFKNLRYYPYHFSSLLTVYARSEKEKASLKREARQVVKMKQRWIEVTGQKVTGKMFNRKGEYRYYTAELFDYIFFPPDTAPISNIISRKDSGQVTATGKNEKNTDKLKTLLFNPGAEVPGVPLVGSKLAIFDSSMMKFYDYRISTATFRDSIPCYVFSCRVKDNYREHREGKTVIKELVSYFDRRNFNIVYRTYDLAYRSVLFDFDVKIKVELKTDEARIVPEQISYAGYWDIPFQSPEIVNFTIRFEDFYFWDK